MLGWTPAPQGGRQPREMDGNEVEIENIWMDEVSSTFEMLQQCSPGFWGIEIGVGSSGGLGDWSIHNKTELGQLLLFRELEISKCIW